VTSIAAQERTLLCALAQQLGPDAPTLCGEWSVKDLVVHLLLREGHPSAMGILVPGLDGVLERATSRTSSTDFVTLVKRLRNGPPVWSPFAIPKLGSAMNLLEFYIHHEDVRRAQPAWVPRTLPGGAEDGIWRATRLIGRGTMRRAPVGVVLERSDNGARATLKKGDRQVVLRGLPSELALYVYGRQPQSKAEPHGDDADVAALGQAPLGL
jgi:uncharacterized protein (TIGR03085 family)